MSNGCQPPPAPGVTIAEADEFAWTIGEIVRGMLGGAMVGSTLGHCFGTEPSKLPWMVAGAGFGGLLGANFWPMLARHWYHPPPRYK